MKFCVAPAVAPTALIAAVGGSRADQNLRTLPTGNLDRRIMRRQILNC